MEILDSAISQTLKKSDKSIINIYLAMINYVTDIVGYLISNSIHFLFDFAIGCPTANDATAQNRLTLSHLTSFVQSNQLAAKCADDLAIGSYRIGSHRIGTGNSVIDLEGGSRASGVCLLMLISCGCGWDAN